QEFDAPPGTATFVRVRARPTTRFLRGSERQMPFQIAISAQDVTPPVVVPGTVRQHAILPPWLFRVGAVGVLASVAWVAMLKPRIDQSVQQVAQAEAVKVTAPIAPKVEQLAKQDTEQKVAASGGAQPAAAPAPPAPSATGAPGPAGPAGPAGPPGPQG